MFGFVFLPGLARAADQNICKQSWVAQAQLCYRKCLFPAKTEVTASRRFNSLHVLSTRSLGLPIPARLPHQLGGHHGGHHGGQPTLNSVGSNNSRSPPRVHTKLCRGPAGALAPPRLHGKKNFKNEENNSILASASEFPPLSAANPRCRYNTKDLKNEANQAMKNEDLTKQMEIGNFSSLFSPSPDVAAGGNCKVKVEQMEADSIHLLSHATAYATL